LMGAATVTFRQAEYQNLLLLLLQQLLALT
jgi:hypothetical protein